MKAARPRVLVDMDNTIVDLFAGLDGDGDMFDHYPCRWDFTGCCTDMHADEVFSWTTLFANAPPIPGAIEGVRRLMERYDVRFVSTPWPTNHETAMAKYRWIEAHGFDPRLLTLTHDKALIPAVALIDDKPDLYGPWHHVTYPAPWNESTWPTWVNGLADEVIAYLPTGWRS